MFKSENINSNIKRNNPSKTPFITTRNATAPGKKTTNSHAQSNGSK